MMAAQPRLPALQLDALPTPPPPKLPSPDMLVAYSRNDYSTPQPPPPPQLPENKRCGWCRTFDTPQWRLGQSSGSAAMGTLCNACGINYRRALHKSRGTLDLDQLARAMGPSRPSIQKSLKRLRRTKRAAASSHGIGFHSAAAALQLVDVSTSRSTEFASPATTAPQSPVDVRTPPTPLLPSIHVLLNGLTEQEEH